MTPYEALYDCKCRSPVYWDKVANAKLLSLKIVQQIVEVMTKIQEWMKTMQSQ